MELASELLSNLGNEVSGGFRVLFDAPDKASQSQSLRLPLASVSYLFMYIGQGCRMPLVFLGLSHTGSLVQVDTQIAVASFQSEDSRLLLTLQFFISSVHLMNQPKEIKVIPNLRLESSPAKTFLFPMEYVHELSLWNNLLLDHGYELLGQLDSGSFSDVFAVRKITSHQLMAVKRMVTRREITLDPRVKAEIRCLNELSMRSACVIRLLETIIKFDRLACLVLELAPLGNLENYILDHWPLSQRLMKAATGQVLSALTHCHRLNIAHRDITPGNVLLMSVHSFRLADFGLAVRCTDSSGRRVKCNDYLGRHAYLAPEVLLEKPYDAIQADMWSMGCLCIFMLTGKHPEGTHASHSFLGRRCVTTKSHPPEKPSFLWTQSCYPVKNNVPTCDSCGNKDRRWLENKQEDQETVPCSPTLESGMLPSVRTSISASGSFQQKSEVVDSDQWDSITTDVSEEISSVASAMDYLVSKLQILKPNERLSSENALEFWEQDS